jgi:hypothetical protein
VLAAVGALELGLFIHDAYLVPLFVGFMAMTLWLLYRSAHGHADLRPFWLGLGGGVLGSASLWLPVIRLFPVPMMVYLALALVVVGSVWDLMTGHRVEACAPATSEMRITPKGIYKSVDAFAPKAEAGTIACWKTIAARARPRVPRRSIPVTLRALGKGGATSTFRLKNVRPKGSCPLKALRPIRERPRANYDGLSHP